MECVEEQNNEIIVLQSIYQDHFIGNITFSKHFNPMVGSENILDELDKKFKIKVVSRTSSSSGWSISSQKYLILTSFSFIGNHLSEVIPTTRKSSSCYFGL